MGNSILDIGLSGINAAQFALSTTSNNIANASTPGYAQEVANFEAAIGTGTGAGFIGSGVNTVSVTRQFSQFLNGQLNQATGMGGSLTAFNTEAEALNTTVGDPTTGLTTGFTQLFTGLQAISGNASQAGTLPPALGNFQSIVDTFNSMTTQFDTTRSGVNTQLSAAVTQVNTLSAQIAALNKQIVVQQASTGQSPNQLLDERDAAVTSLSQLVGASTTSNPDGTINVTIGNGQSLVNGSMAYNLQTVPSASDPSELSIAYTVNGPGGTTTSIPITDSQFSSGTIGGLMQFRSQVLDPQQRQLGNLATTFATLMNAQNQAGVTLSGQAGGALFNIPQPGVNAAAGNTGGASLSAAFGGPTLNQLTGDNYTLSFDGTNFSLQDTTTGAAPVPVTFTNGVANVDGMTLTLNPATMAAGDSFQIKGDTRQAGALMSMATTNPNDIAAGSPSAAASVGTANIGTGTVSAASTSKPYQGALLAGTVTGTFNAGPPATITFAQGTAGDAMPSVSVTSGGTTTTTAPTGTPPTVTVPFVAGQPMVIGGVSVTISGAPVTGDTFALTADNGSGDNTNAQAMSDLLDDNTVMPGNQTFSGAYSTFVGTIGSAAATSTTSLAAQTALINQVTASQQSVSGVNLDQEATNMLQFEQLYQSNAKVISAATTTFTALLNAIG